MRRFLVALSTLILALLDCNVSQRILPTPQNSIRFADFDHFNPQTQETSFPFKGTAFGKNKAADQPSFVSFGQSAPDDGLLFVISYSNDNALPTYFKNKHFMQ